MTKADIEDLLVTKITALVDGLGAARFARVLCVTEGDFRLADVTPAQYPLALVAFASDQNTGVKSRLVMNETYRVTVVKKKAGADSTQAIHTLCDAVRDGIHGKDWDYADITPFEYQGREIIDAGEQVIAFELRFGTTNILHIPVTS